MYTHIHVLKCIGKFNLILFLYYRNIHAYTYFKLENLTKNKHCTLSCELKIYFLISLIKISFYKYIIIHC